MSQPSILDMARRVVRDTVVPGALALDATVGRGHDTLLLAKLVGEKGLVVGLDVQEAALNATQSRLSAAGLLDRVLLVQDGHERADRLLQPYVRLPFLAAMYNLGYLPGSSRRVVTEARTTIASLEAIVPLLVPGGIVTITAYRGHKGGPEESKAVVEWGKDLPAPEFSVSEYRLLNRGRHAPHLVIISRNSSG